MQKKYLALMGILIFIAGIAIGYYIPQTQEIPELTDESKISGTPKEFLDIKGDREFDVFYLNGNILSIDKIGENQAIIELTVHLTADDRLASPASVSRVVPKIAIDEQTILWSIEKRGEIEDPQDISIDELILGRLVTINTEQQITDILFREEPYQATRIIQPDTF
jgi:hypothetical protein